MGRHAPTRTWCGRVELSLEGHDQHSPDPRAGGQRCYKQSTNLADSCAAPSAEKLTMRHLLWANFCHGSEHIARKGLLRRGARLRSAPGPSRDSIDAAIRAGRAPWTKGHWRRCSDDGWSRSCYSDTPRSCSSSRSAHECPVPAPLVVWSIACLRHCTRELFENFDYLVIEFLGNILMFMPLGVFTAMLLGKRSCLELVME